MMKLLTLLPFVAVGAAFVVLDDKTAAQLVLVSEADPSSSSSSTVDWLGPLMVSVEHTLDAEDAAVSALSEFVSQVDGTSWNDINFLDDEDLPRQIHPGRHPHHRHDKTIYQLIADSPHTTKLVSVIDQYPDIVDVLNDTEADFTLFAPIDSAFEHLPKDKEFSKEELESILKYHVGAGCYPARKLLGTHTLPSLLHEKALGGKPQRLRTTGGPFGVRVNFFTKVVAANIEAKNGVIHAVNRIIMPPPFAGKELSLAPTIFSTLLHAFEKTDFVEYIHHQPMNGSTVFAPTNHAFERLGPHVNAFLFNSPKGLKYLKAILKFHIVANVTQYGDAVYHNSADAIEQGRRHKKHCHVDLPTLLNDLTVAVDIFSLHSFNWIKVNRQTTVTISDVVAKNGVVHILHHVLIPRHHHFHDHETETEEMTVEDLIEALSPYIGEEALNDL